MDIQACIPVALAVVHNFIHRHKLVEDDEMRDEDEDGPGGGRAEDVNDGNDGAELYGVGVNELDVRRDAIVSIMWDQYLQEHIDRGLALPGAM